MTHNKLVRDKIPDIIRKKGEAFKIHIAGDDEYREKLKEKLTEEVAEFLREETAEELADVLEVIYALAESKGILRHELERVRLAKIKERGAFAHRVILEEF